MARDGLQIGEAAKQAGASRKALCLYEAAGILPAAWRTSAGYRVYGAGALDLLGFIRRAQRLGFTLDEIKEIVSIKRAGRVPCPHVRDLVRRKTGEPDQRLLEMRQLRDCLRALLDAGARQAEGLPSAHTSSGRKRSHDPEGGRSHGEHEDVAVSNVRPL